MDEEYDVIVLGTGLKECILSGLMSVDGKKVLHMDKNGYYGGESASLTLQQLFEQYRKEASTPPEELGKSRDYAIDLIPKFIMACGKLVKVLLHTKTTRYMEFKQVEGSYVVKGGKVHKVPATETEALQSPLMGILEKRRFRKFLVYVQECEEEDEKTYGKYDLKTMPMRALYKEFGLAEDTIDFVGHAIALHTNDSYLEEPALSTVLKCKLYSFSLAQYGKSPYIYPLYGLGELPQAFSRLSAVHGGTYMLSKPFSGVVYDDNGKVCGVKSTGEDGKEEVAKLVSGGLVIASPDYFPEKCVKTGSVVRCICFLSKPLPNTHDSQSSQIIIPQKQTGRKSDIYVTCMGESNKVAPAGHYVVIVSTTVETDDPKKDIEPGLKLLGPIDDAFVIVNDLWAPAPGKEDSADGIFVSKSYDATSHFETSIIDVLEIFDRITGKALDLNAVKEDDEQ